MPLPTVGGKGLSPIDGAECWVGRLCQGHSPSTRCGRCHSAGWGTAPAQHRSQPEAPPPPHMSWPRAAPHPEPHPQEAKKPSPGGQRDPPEGRERRLAEQQLGTGLGDSQHRQGPRCPELDGMFWGSTLCQLPSQRDPLVLLPLVAA